MKYDNTRVIFKHMAVLRRLLSKHSVDTKEMFLELAKKDEEFERATLMTVQCVGELAYKKFETESRAAHGGVNWRRMKVARNVISHDYDVVDMGAVADIIFEDIPALEKILTESGAAQDE